MFSGQNDVVDHDGTLTGEHVLLAAVAHARTEFGENLAACYAIGSLAHGGFAPLVSDVDLVAVLNDGDGVVEEGILRVTDAVRHEVEGPLAQRLSVFWSDWSGVRSGAGTTHRLPAIDRLDLLESGRLLYGQDNRQPATAPSHNELIIDSAEFALSKIDEGYRAKLHHPSRLVAAGARAVTKTTLFPVRFLYTLATNRVGRNQDAIDWYRGPSHPLVQAAARWRYEGLDTTADALLTDHLNELYTEFVDAYIGAAPARNHTELMLRLVQLRGNLVDGVEKGQ
jgi:hypothetical protein